MRLDGWMNDEGWIIDTFGAGSMKSLMLTTPVLVPY